MIANEFKSLGEKFKYKNHIIHYIVLRRYKKMELTTIQLEKSTLQKLKEFKEYARETYDEIVNKLMKYKEMTEPQLTEETIRDIDESRKEKSIPLSESIKRLGVKIDL